MEEINQQEQPKSTVVVENGVKNKKKPVPSGIVVGAALLFIVVFGGLIFMMNKGESPVQPAHKPTAADIAQQKIDADRATREQRQVSGLRDDDFFIRDERLEPETGQLYRGLNTEAPKTNYSWEDQQTEEETINYILRGSTAQARREDEARTAAAVADGNGTTYQQNNSRTADGNNNNNQSQMPPMFVYSRSFGGAKYTESAAQSRQNGQSGQVAENQNSFQFSEDQLLRMAMGLPASTTTTASDDEFDVQAMAAADKQAQLIYTGHSPVVVHEGEMLEAVLRNKLIVNVEPSPVVCSLSRDLFDKSGKYVVFPANSQVIGQAQAVSYKGASRLFISFHRIILPNGLSIDLPQSPKMMKAMDETGAIGVASHVNRHWMLQFGTAIALGVIDGIAGYAQRNSASTDADTIIYGRTSENFSRVLDKVMESYSSIMPTISVFQGKTIRIYIAADMLVSPYQLISNRSYYGKR